MHQEVELKLTGAAGDLAAAFQSLTGEGRAPARVISTYFDAEDDRLRRRGFTLRLREKSGGYDLTLKGPVGDSLARGEWTSPVTEPVPDIGRLPAEAPRSRTGVVLPEELSERFTTDIERTRKIVTSDAARVEVSLDIGEIRAGGNAMPVAELEFELLDGPVSAMLALVQGQFGRRRFTVSTRSKSARGMELLEGRPPAPVRAVRPVLDAADTVETAVSKIIGVTALQIVGNLPASEDGRDPEGVHQLRVALRRLRSAMTLFKGRFAVDPAPMTEPARSALKLLGPARDLDVFLTETVPPVAAGTEDGPGLLRLAALAEERRRAAYDDVRRLVGDRAFNRFVVDLLLAGERGGLVLPGANDMLRPLAASLLHKRHKKVLKIGRGFADMPIAERHEVRIALKKLRYACDFFQTLFPKRKTAVYLKRLASLQDDLGRLNDATVADTMVDELAAGDDDATVGAALVKGWYGHRLRAVEPHMVEAWSRFAEARPFWHD